MFGCTLESCLKKFLDAEKVENYFCQKCWHGAALKYLSVIGATEVIHLSGVIIIVPFPRTCFTNLSYPCVLETFQSDRYRKAQELWWR